MYVFSWLALISKFSISFTIISYVLANCKEIDYIIIPDRLQVFLYVHGFIMMSPLFKAILKFCTTNHLFTFVISLLVWKTAAFIKFEAVTSLCFSILNENSFKFFVATIL